MEKEETQEFPKYNCSDFTGYLVENEYGLLMIPPNDPFIRQFYTAIGEYNYEHKTFNPDIKNNPNMWDEFFNDLSKLPKDLS